MVQFFERSPLTQPRDGFGRRRTRTGRTGPGSQPRFRVGTGPACLPQFRVGGTPVVRNPTQQIAERHQTGTRGCRHRLPGFEQGTHLLKIAQERLHAFRTPVTMPVLEIKAERAHLLTENVSGPIPRGASRSRSQLIETLACEAQTMTAIPVPGVTLQGPMDPGKQILERAGIPGFVGVLHLRFQRPSVVGAVHACGFAATPVSHHPGSG